MLATLENIPSIADRGSPDTIRAKFPSPSTLNSNSTGEEKKESTPPPLRDMSLTAADDTVKVRVPEVRSNQERPKGILPFVAEGSGEGGALSLSIVLGMDEEGCPSSVHRGESDLGCYIYGGNAIADGHHDAIAIHL